MTLTEPTLSTEQIVRAATNNPAMSKVSFDLGDKTFPIVDLTYDSYIRFLALLQPLLTAVASRISGGIGISLGPEMEPMQLVQTCADALPELVCIICEQTDPDITVEDVKRMGKTPFKLAAIVIKQVHANNMIVDITDFFAQILPLMTNQETPEKEAPKRKYRTKATRSS